MSFDNLSAPAEEFFEKGLAAFKKKNYGYAIALFTEVLNVHPDFFPAEQHLWLALREKRKISSFSLLTFISEKIKIFFLTIKVFLYLASNRSDSAIVLQKKIVLLNPDNISSLSRLATFLIRQKHIDQAKIILEQILLIDKTNTFALRQLAILYFAENNFPKAKLLAKVLLEINPHDLPAEKIIKDIDALGAIAEGFDNIKPSN